MRSKTWALNAISFCMLPLLTAGCLSDNLLSDHPDTPNGPMEIRMNSYIVGGTSPTTRVDDAKGMINGGTAFDVKFARVDENAANTNYPDTYGSDAIPGSVNVSKELSFNPPAYYQTDKAKKTKLIGWHPTEATYTSSAGTVAFAAIDGETDIIVTALKEGSQNSQFENIGFTHLLMQISVKIYTADEKNKYYWGGIKSITIAGKKQTCTVTLPATSSSDGTAIAAPAFAGTDALPLVQKDPSNNTAINQGSSAYGASNPLVLGVEKTNAVLAGYAMFAPAGSNAITLTVVTEKGGTQTVTVSKPQSADFVAGGSYVVCLNFGVSTISPTGTSITDWSTPTDLPEITV